MALAQEKPKYIKTTYISPEGKIYLNKDLPVYLWLSTSPNESAKKVRLTSEESRQYSNPLYFDTEGYNSVRTPSAVDTVTKKAIFPLRDIIFEVYTDSKPPYTKISYGGAKTYKKNGVVHIKSGVKITLTTYDATSGIKETLYSIDGEAFKAYSGPLNLNQQKEYTVKYFSVDNVGNDEGVKEVKIFIDKSAPISKIDIEGDEHNSILSDRALLKIVSEDNLELDKIYYSLDSGKERVYSEPLKMKYYSQGEHSITYYATDKTGHVEGKKKI